MPDEPFLTSPVRRGERPYSQGGLEHRRLGISGFFKFLIVLASLAVFAGVLWYAFRSGPPPDGGPVTIAGPEEPHRTRPDQPGGQQVPNQDKDVFETAVGNSPAESEVSLAEGAEEPVEVPAPAAQPSLVGQDGDESSAGESGAQSQSQDDAEPEQQAQAVNQTDEAPKVLSRPPGAGAEEAATGDVELSAPGQEPATDPATDPASATADPRSSEDSTASKSTVSVNWDDAFLIQIGAFKELETAEDAWNAARRRFADIMSDKAANIRKAEIPGRGTWYRVRIGPYETRRAAEAVCTDLKERGQDCLVAAP